MCVYWSLFKSPGCKPFIRAEFSHQFTRNCWRHQPTHTSEIHSLLSQRKKVRVIKERPFSQGINALLVFNSYFGLLKIYWRRQNCQWFNQNFDWTIDKILEYSNNELFVATLITLIHTVSFYILSKNKEGSNKDESQACLFTIFPCQLRQRNNVNKELVIYPHW